MIDDGINKPRVVEEKRINGKPVYIFEDHATALVAWSRIGRELPVAPYIITLDRHLDTRPAFNGFLRSKPERPRDFWAESRRLVSLIKLDTESAAKVSLRYLRNEEHIQAAIEAGILSFAFVMSPRAERDGFCPECAEIFEMKLGDEQGSIEATVLAPKLRWIGSTMEALGLKGAPMILDIDLDFFESMETVAPADPSGFFALVRDALAVTIAQEPAYAATGVDHDQVLAALLALLGKASEPNGLAVGS